MSNADFNEYKQHIILELARLNTCILALEKKFEDLLVGQTELKVKAGIWGLLGGLIPTIGAILLYVLYQIAKAKSGAPGP